MNPEDWNRIGRAENLMVCRELEAVIDDGRETSMDFTVDSRSVELAEAVLAEVVALNADGRWREARKRFDPAYLPYSSKTDHVELRAVAVLGPDRFLVRIESGVLLIDGDVDEIRTDIVAFGLSRDRRWLALATADGIIVTTDLDASASLRLPWPPLKDGAFDADSLCSLDVANDGRSLVIASDSCGIWLVRNGSWTELAPRPGVGDDWIAENDNCDAADDGCGVKVGSYAELRARYGAPSGMDVTHVAISPDGHYVAYGWQDSPGHYLDRIAGGSLDPLGTIEPDSDYPYCLRFSDDSRFLLSNSRHFSAGATRCVEVEAFPERREEAVCSIDDYLRANSIAELPSAAFGREGGVAWIGGVGWSHAASFGSSSGDGKPVFTQLFGESLCGMDYDPRSRRAVVIGTSGILHVMDPFVQAEPGTERGYHPRGELYRILLWDRLGRVVRW
ncbi:MAG: hypothetical protein FWD68_11720 [Alphaproteobacteria bacterium]|nr:hypothetical protein [Alphaproteobacteria bacterium]